MAPRSEVNLSREAVRILEVAGQVSVENLQDRVSYLLADQPLEPQTSRVITQPSQLQLTEDIVVHLQFSSNEASSVIDDSIMRTIEGTAGNILPMGGRGCWEAW